MGITLKPFVRGDTKMEFIEEDVVTAEVIEGDTRKPFVQPVQEDDGG